MKRFIVVAVLLSACHPSTPEETKVPAQEKAPVSSAVVAVKPGVVRLRLKTPVSEPFACIVPIQVENGLDTNTNVTMIAFDVTGPGKASKGNMFAPMAEAGKVTEARVVIEGQSCEAYDTISIPEIRCTSGEENCAPKVELIDGETLRFSQAG